MEKSNRSISADSNTATPIPLPPSHCPAPSRFPTSPSKWNQQSPLSRRLAEEGRLVSIIREMAEQVEGQEGDLAVVVEAVRRVEEEERAVVSAFCGEEREECEEGERYRRVNGACNNLAGPQVLGGHSRRHSLCYCSDIFSFLIFIF